MLVKVFFMKDIYGFIAVDVVNMEELALFNVGHSFAEPVLFGRSRSRCEGPAPAPP